MVAKQLSISNLRETLERVGQEHVLKFWEKISQTEQDLLLGQLSRIPLDQLETFFVEATTEEKSAGDSRIKPLDAKDIVRKSATDKVRLEEWKTAGLEAIGLGKLAVVTLAGGQGTRLGSSAPKGCYNIGLPSGKSLFQLQAERLLRLQKLTGAQILWYIMTSLPTDAETKAFFEAHDYFGLDSSLVCFFQQGFLPALDGHGKIMMASKGSLSVAPDGNGGIYRALLTEGILEDLESRGIDYVHMHSVDNCLVLVADPIFLGIALERGSDAASKSVPKTNPKESVGVLCLKNGKAAVAEYSELDPKVAEAVDANGNLLFNEANIANHLFSLEFLRRICTDQRLKLPYHVARKKIPSIDLETGEILSPPPMGIKLEAFIFDVLEHSERPLVYQVLREEEFAPLKNAPASASEDTPEFCAERLSSLHRNWLMAAGATLTGEGRCEVSPLLSYSGEDLEERFAGITISLPALLETEMDRAKL